MSSSFSFWTFVLHVVMPLVTFVKWDQGGCVAPTGEVGNCLPASDCQIRGGIAGGQCAGGLYLNANKNNINNYTSWYANPNSI